MKKCRNTEMPEVECRAKYKKRDINAVINVKDIHIKHMLLNSYAKEQGQNRLRSSDTVLEALGAEVFALPCLPRVPDLGLGRVLSALLCGSCAIVSR
jgi:hypothetical protein